MQTTLRTRIILAFLLGVCCTLLVGDSLPTRSLEPPVMLPDGTEFRTWEQPVRFSRTYYVDQAHSEASDTNAGTKERPLATINRAAEILQPGERVVVAAGTYRERVRPARGGSGPDQMITYEAAPGATVVIKGSRVFQPVWRQSTALAAANDGVWEAKLDPALFDGYNPFAIDNVTPRQFEIMDWATPLRGKVPYTLPRGLVFQDGKLLRQVATVSELAAGEGAYWVDRTNQVLHLRLADAQKPGQANLELTTQETVFAPEKPGLGYLRVKGFTIEQVGGPFPWEQVGAISTTRGHHWIIEDNVVRWVNGVGMDLGVQSESWEQPPVVGFHIVRRNVVTDCGICGICGLGPARGRDFGLLIEDNVLARNAFHDVERLYETGGIKTHNNIRCLIRRNIILDTLHGAGIWMDWNNQFSRCMGNLIVGSHTMHGGIFIEASYEPNLVDQNVILNTDGHGIYEHDSSGQVFANNLIAHSSKSGLHLHGKITDRRVDGRTMTYGRHSVLNNVWIGNAKPNEFLGDPSTVALNVEDGATGRLDLESQEFAWEVPESGRRCPLVPGVTYDLLGLPRDGKETCAGPFASSAGRTRLSGPWPASDRIWLASPATLAPRGTKQPSTRNSMKP
jgi:alpha-N-arabinofuranosidase